MIHDLKLTTTAAALLAGGARLERKDAPSGLAAIENAVTRVASEACGSGPAPIPTSARCR